MAQPKQAKRVIRLEDAPTPSGLAIHQPNGDTIYEDGDHRWRFNAEGVLKYYFRTQPGKGRETTPYEEMYRDRSA